MNRGQRTINVKIEQCHVVKLYPVYEFFVKLIISFYRLLYDGMYH